MRPTTVFPSSLAVLAGLALSSVSEAKTPLVPQCSLPWALRPAIASSVVRSDTAFAYFDGGNTVASTLLVVPFAIGPRANFALADGVVARPGIAFAMPLDDPMKTAGYKIVQLDIPVTF